MKSNFEAIKTTTTTTTTRTKAALKTLEMVE
jgi:hypothetical protein